MTKPSRHGHRMERERDSAVWDTYLASYLHPKSMENSGLLGCFKGFWGRCCTKFWGPGTCIRLAMRLTWRCIALQCPIPNFNRTMGIQPNAPDQTNETRRTNSYQKKTVLGGSWDFVTSYNWASHPTSNLSIIAPK